MVCILRWLLCVCNKCSSGLPIECHTKKSCQQKSCACKKSYAKEKCCIRKKQLRQQESDTIEGLCTEWLSSEYKLTVNMNEDLSNCTTLYNTLDSVTWPIILNKLNPSRHENWSKMWYTPFLHKSLKFNYSRNCKNKQICLFLIHFIEILPEWIYSMAR